MAGYQRQSQNDIYDGNSIEADHLNNEFDELQAAFNVTGGHKHDGSTGGGAYITQVGPTGGITFTDTTITPTSLGTTINFEGLGGFEASGDVSIGGNVTFGAPSDQITTQIYGDIITDGEVTIGGSGINNFSGSVNMNGGATLSGAVTINGSSSQDFNVSSRYVNITANTSGSSFMKGVQVGDSSNKKNGYFDTVYFNSISSTSGNISIGTGDITADDITADEVTCDIVNTKTANSSSSTDAGIKFGNNYYMFADNSKLYMKTSSTNWITFDAQSFPNKINMHQEIQVMNTNWSIYATSQYIYFKNSNQNIMRLDSSGNMLIKGSLSEFQSFIS